MISRVQTSYQINIGTPKSLDFSNTKYWKETEHFQYTNMKMWSMFWSFGDTRDQKIAVYEYASNLYEYASKRSLDLHLNTIGIACRLAYLHISTRT